jgi:hypothetical protein
VWQLMGHACPAAPHVRLELHSTETWHTAVLCDSSVFYYTKYGNDRTATIHIKFPLVAPKARL